MQPVHNSTLKEVKLGIGGITVLLNAVDDILLEINEAQKRFFTTMTPDLALELRGYDREILRTGSKKIVFDSNGIWDLYRNERDYIFNCYSDDFGPEPYKTAVINSDFSSGHIYIDKAYSQSGPSYPFGYPLDEILIIHLLSLGRGMIVHGCGVKIADSGILFVGASGRGKSTIARLLESGMSGVILNDDRIIIRKIGSRFWMYGTPWHGDVQQCLQEAVPLKKIYFIEHAEDNFSKKLRPIDAAAKLIALSFSPCWDTKGMQFILDLSSEISENIPSFELGFLPDHTIVKFLKDKL